MPRIVRFTAAPLTIAAGGTSTLLWAVDNASSVSIDQGVGTVSTALERTMLLRRNDHLHLTATNNSAR